MRSWSALIVFLLLAAAAAGGGWFFPPGDWYASLARPWYAPPNWVFGPVWTALYLMIAVAGWLAWREVGLKSRAVLAWSTQMILNAAWTPLFFGAHMLGAALIEMALLWAAIAWCIVAFWAVSRPAAWLMVPYLVWVSFAWLLNLGFWMLNR